MRISFWKSICIFAVIVLCAFAGYRIYRVYASAIAALNDERGRNSQNAVTFEKISYTAHDRDVVKIIQGVGGINDLAVFQDSYYAATDGGLIQLSRDGDVVRHFTVLDGLPESELTCLATFAGKLFIGTSINGLVAFDGNSFEGYKFVDSKGTTISTLAENEGRLLIGIFSGGLLEFDGKYFTEIRAGKEKVKGVKHIRKIGPKLYVGTFANGLYVYENDTWSHYTTTEGLPSNRVVGIESLDDQLYVNTDFGLAVFDNNAFRSIATVPTLAGAATFEGRLYLVKDDGAVSTFDRTLSELQPSPSAEKAKLVSLDEKLWLISSDGISVFRDSRFGEFSKPTGGLTNNFVSALTFSENGDLWAGTFRNGMDVVSPGGEPRHIESEGIREINYLASRDGVIAAATSAGLFTIEGADAAKSITVRDGLPSNSVTHFSGDFISTAKGLAFGHNGRLRVLTTVQGLPNNSVYTGIPVGEKYYAGTLGGVAEIVDGRVVRTFTDANSGLTTNWVTAFCLAGDRLFIGTYGGGLFELTPSGEVRPLSSEARHKFTVNPNALYSDGERLYAGTLTGVEVMDLRSLEWRTLTDVLPSQTVMSVTGDTNALYFGTKRGISRVEKAYFERGNRK